MQVQTRQGPAYGVARLTLGPNEPVRVECGAMMAMSAGVTLQSKAEGGIMKSLKRAALGGESFFVSTYTAPPQGGFVDVAARLPGDVIDLRGRARPRAVHPEGFVAGQRGHRAPSTPSGAASRTCSAARAVSSSAPKGRAWSCSPATARSRCGTSRPVRRITDRHRPHGGLRGHRCTMSDAQGQRWRHGAELQERRGPRVRLHRPGPGVDADAQPERVPGLDPELRRHRQLGRRRRASAACSAGTDRC